MNIVALEAAMLPQAETKEPIVNSHTEWDPLEEVILGLPQGAFYPTWHPAVECTVPEANIDLLRRVQGTPFPNALLDEAKREIDALSKVLEAEGIVVRHPSDFDHSKGFSTPYWSSSSGLYSAMPRDVFLVIGDEIIEAPMAWRCRHYESFAYRDLMKGYFRAGARWTAAPTPTLRDEQFTPLDRLGEESNYLVTEFEPTFDAADFLRCGRDIFAQRSHVTNRMGIEWLSRHLGPRYQVHEVTTEDEHPMHIDATMALLAPGKLLANPERLPRIPAQFKNWEVRYAPAPSSNRGAPLFLSSSWISMNVLSIDTERVLVESRETELKDMLKAWGLQPIPVDFQAFNALGGSFHCATLDIRRKGEGGAYL